MAANVRVNQSVLEIATLVSPNVRCCQSIIEFVTQPYTPPPTIAPIKITLRGVKRVRTCGAEPEVTEVPALPSVQRAV